ncbi:MAG: aminopeptidase P family protein [Acidimicrobiales bacterium]
MRNAELAPMDRAARLARVRAAVAEAGCDGLIVTKELNVRWLSGFTGSNATAVITPESFTIVTDGRYQSQIEEQLAAADVTAEVVITREPREPLLAALGDARRIGLESENVTWSTKRRFAEWFEAGLPGHTIVATSELIETERRFKDRGEIDRLKLAAAIADQALDQVRSSLDTGVSEVEVARQLDGAMMDLGADGLSFATIVASGPNSAKPHATPSDRVIGPGDMVVIDFGAKVDGYGSDMTRSFLIGEPSARQREVFDAVIASQAAGVAAVRDGVEEREIDRICRKTLADHNLEEAFIHGTGHGIGLEIHENPMLSTRATGILRSGYVVTVEPGAYLPELGGIRIEDSVVVTDSGCEPITHSSKSPIV